MITSLDTHISRRKELPKCPLTSGAIACISSGVISHVAVKYCPIILNTYTCNIASKSLKNLSYMFVWYFELTQKISKINS